VLRASRLASLQPHTTRTTRVTDIGTFTHDCGRGTVEGGRDGRAGIPNFLRQIVEAVQGQCRWHTPLARGPSAFAAKL
jgi:hypothetical protein